MGEKRRDVASARQLEAEVFSRLSKRESHEAIATALDVSRQHVTRLAAKFRAELEAAAEATKSAAVNGAVRAREMAQDAAPDAMRLLVEQINDDGLPPNERRDAAKTLLDRAGVSAKVDLNHGGSALEAVAAALLAAKKSAEGE